MGYDGTCTGAAQERRHLSSQPNVASYCACTETGYCLNSGTTTGDTVSIIHRVPTDTGQFADLQLVLFDRLY